MFEYLNDELYQVTAQPSRQVTLQERTPTECQFQDRLGQVYTLTRVITEETRTRVTGSLAVSQEGGQLYSIPNSNFQLTKRQLTQTTMSATIDHLGKLYIALTDDATKQTTLTRYELTNTQYKQQNRMVLDNVRQTLLVNGVGDSKDWTEPDILLISLSGTPESVVWRQLNPSEGFTLQEVRKSSKTLPDASKLGMVGHTTKDQKSGIWFTVLTPKP